MNTIDFNNIDIEGFRSFMSPEDFSYLKPGINLVKGKNGSGKSTLIEGLYWALYGENLKGTTKTKIPTKKQYQSKDFKGTRVAVNFEVNGVPHLVARHIKYKGKTLGLKGDDKLMLFTKTGEREWQQYGDGLHNDDVQNHILSLLKVDSNTFLNSVLFGQKMKRLVEATPSDKREIFEKLFNLDFVSAAKEKAKAKKAEAESKLLKAEKFLSSEETILQNELDKLEEDKETLANFDKEKQEKLDALGEKISSLKKKVKKAKKERDEYTQTIGELNEEINNLPDYSKQEEEVQERIDLCNKSIKEYNTTLEDLARAKRDINSSITSYDRELNQSNSKIKILKVDIENVDTHCPTCGSDLALSDVEKAKDALRNSIKTEKEVIKVLKAKVDKIKEEGIPTLEKEEQGQLKLISQDKKLLEELDAKMGTIPDTSEVKSKLEKGLNTAETDLKLVNKDIANYKDLASKYKEDLEEVNNTEIKGIDLEVTEAAIETAKFNIDETQTDIATLTEVLSKINWWINKGFGSSGIKSYVFFAMLNNLNKSILKYCDRLGVMVQFSVDMEKASKPFLTRCFTSEGVEMDYNELSGGEQARINVATAFAFYDLIADSTTKFNCIFLDETFAGLDEDGLYQAFDLVRSICGVDKNIFIITHKTNIDMRNTKTIDIEKGPDKISRIL